MAKRSVFPAIVLAALTMAAGAGCQTMAETNTFTVGNPFKIVPERPLADVPVPSGYTYRKNWSYVFNGNYRVARLEYRGAPQIDATVQYFKDQMPASRWTLVTDSGMDDRVVTFHNESEEMLIKLGRMGGITQLSIEIKPRST